MPAAPAPTETSSVDQVDEPPLDAPGRAGTVLTEGARVLRDAGRLLAEHWPALLGLALTAYVARALLLDLAVVASRSSAVASNLVQALIPFAQLLTVVAMFLVVRARQRTPSATPAEVSVPDAVRDGVPDAAPGSSDSGTEDAPRRRRRTARASRALSTLVVAASAVLVPFLLVYQRDGALAEDSLALGWALVGDLDEGGTVLKRLAQATSLDVLLTVVAALVVRRLVVVLVRRTRPEREGRRAGLRLVSGYAEAVWLVLGAVVVTEGVGAASSWWHTRAAGAALDAWWQEVSFAAPALADAVEALLTALGLVAGGAATALLVPLAWLNLAAVVYGVEAAKVLRARDLAAQAAGVTRAGAAQVGALLDRVGDERTDRALARLTDPERRFGAVIGAAGLIARAGWRPALVVCLVFLVADNLDALLWELARVLVGPQSLTAWMALEPVLDGVGEVVASALTTVVIAAAADALLVRIGLPSALRLDTSGRAALPQGLSGPPLPPPPPQPPQGAGSAA